MPEQRSSEWTVERIARLLSQSLPGEDRSHLTVKHVEATDVWHVVNQNIEHWEGVPKVERVSDFVEGGHYVLLFLFKDEQHTGHSDSCFYIYLNVEADQPKKATLRAIRERSIGIEVDGKLDEEYRKELTGRVESFMSIFVIILNAIIN